jgi:hypothetical protein
MQQCDFPRRTGFCPAALPALQGDGVKWKKFL